MGEPGEPPDPCICQKTVYGVGETFFEMGPEESMLVKNEDPDIDAVVVGTFIVPVGAAPLTITTEHLCGIEHSLG